MLNKSLIDIKFASTTANVIDRETSFKTGQNSLQKSLWLTIQRLIVEGVHSLITPSTSPQANVEMALLKRIIFVFLFVGK